jgi:hypothetical protein
MTEDADILVSEAPKEGLMANSDRKCANPNCLMFGKATNLSVCRRCHRATVGSIYRPRTPPTNWLRPAR